jgi:hypothetical protein
VTLANGHNNKKKGAHVAEYPEDLHLRLCVTRGGKTLRDKLKALMLKTIRRCFKPGMIDLALEEDSPSGRWVPPQQSYPKKKTFTA